MPFGYNGKVRKTLPVGEYMEKEKIQWHPGFVAAMNLEFMENRGDLEFESEHNLNRKPLEIDLLIIKKEPFVQIANEIGAIFRGHNIIEYKSPEDHLDIDVFYKIIAYASLYKSYGRTVDERKADEITVTIIRNGKPKGLFKYFKEQGYTMTNPCKGIYRLEERVLFPTQIVVVKELEQKCHTWLRSLSQNLKTEDIRKLLEQRKHMTEIYEKEMADSVLEVALEANKQILEEWKGDEDMFESLMEMMEPELQLRDERIRRESMEKGIRGTVGALREFGIGEAEIKAALIKNYGLSEAEARKYL